MACTREAPCNGVLRQVLLASTFKIEECWNGHRFRLEIPWAGGFEMTRPVVLKTEPAACAHCGRPFQRLRRRDVPLSSRQSG